MSTIENNMENARTLLYAPCGFEINHLRKHAESAEYGACTFLLNGHSIQYRVAKITPKKTGQFVAIWKRNHSGITVPFDLEDELDFMIIAVNDGDKQGQFIFPKHVLAEKKIVTQNGIEGKRGTRVYPPWDKTNNAQAMKTQNWQVKYFCSVNNAGTADLELVKKLLDKKQ